MISLGLGQLNCNIFTSSLFIYQLMSACYHFTIIISSKIYFSITRLPATFHIVGYIMSEIDVNEPKDFMNLDPVRIDCVNRQ